MKVIAAVCSSVGHVRQKNEDNFFLNGQHMSKDSANDGGQFSCTSREERQLYAVCDGMGGERFGKEASLSAVSNMSSLHAKLNNDCSVHELINDYTELANNAILEFGAKGHAGTTLAMLSLHEGGATVAHLGDSRVYLLRRGKLMCLTKDHSEVNRLVGLGIITPDEAKTHPKRHAILRYLGMDSGDVCVTPTYCEVKLENHDRFLLCSDGVTDMLSDSELQSALNGGTAEQAVKRIVDMALAAGGVDNTTAMVVDAENGGLALTGRPVGKDERQHKSLIFAAGAITGAAVLAVIGAVFLLPRLQGRPVAAGAEPPASTASAMPSAAPTDAPIATSTATPAPTVESTATPTDSPMPSPSAAPTSTFIQSPTAAPTATAAPVIPDSNGWEATIPAGVTSADYVIEELRQYRYRDVVETTESSESSLSGWEAVGSRSEYSDWSEPGEWSTTPASNSDTCDVDTREVEKTKTQYRYFYYVGEKDGKTYRYFTKQWLIDNGYTNISDKKNMISDTQWTRTPGWSQTSGGITYYRFTKPGTVANVNAAFSESKTGEETVGTGEFETQYSVRTRTVVGTVYEYRRWGEFSEWQTEEPAASPDTREIKTRTVYKWTHR